MTPGRIKKTHCRQLLHVNMHPQVPTSKESSRILVLEDTQAVGPSNFGVLQTKEDTQRDEG